MAAEILTVDGSQGEGGGQVLRSSLALSLVTGRPIVIEKIRAGRKKPGLMRQHLTAVLAAAEVGGAEVEGAILGYNLANFLRRLALPKGIRQWSLTTLREKLVKIGAKFVRQAKYVTFQLAEVAVPRQLFATILERIGRLAIPLAACRSG